MVVLLILLIALAIAAIESRKYIYALYLLLAMGIATAVYFVINASPLFGIVQLAAMATIVFALKMYLAQIADEPISPQREILPGIVAAGLAVIAVIKIYPLLVIFPSLAVIGLFLVGLYAVTVKRNLAKMVIGIVIMELSADLFLSIVGERSGLITLAGVGAVFLLAVLVSYLYDQAGTLDITKIRELKG